jgi:3-oxoacyl-[acyl-carrier protein] reductase
LQDKAQVSLYSAQTRERALEVVKEMESIKVFPEQSFMHQIVDVSSKSAVDESIQKILGEWGSIDVLVNNAGITRDTLLMKMSEKDWDDVIDINLKSVYNLCQSLVRPMLKARTGKIINISSVVGLTGNAGQAKLLCV